MLSKIYWGLMIISFILLAINTYILVKALRNRKGGNK